MKTRGGWLLGALLLPLLLSCRARRVPVAPPSVPLPADTRTDGPSVPRTLADIQEAYVAVLMDGLDDPDTVIDWAYIMALLDARSPGGFRDQNGNDWTLTEEERSELGRRLRDALPRKRGAALLPAVSTVARLGFNEGPVYCAAALRAWPDADGPTRSWWLGSSWPVLRDERMVPFLLKEIESRPERATPWHVDDLPTLALQRYLVLRPQEGRAIVLKDIGRKEPQFGGAALTALPDGHLPEVDANFRRPLDELAHGSFDMAKHAALAERYGGPDVLVTARALLDRPEQLWNTHLLRVVMSQDREDAFHRIAKALSKRDPQHPYKHRLVLTRVLASNWTELPRYWGPDAAAFVRGYIDDPDPRVAEDAAQLLADHSKID